MLRSLLLSLALTASAAAQTSVETTPVPTTPKPVLTALFLANIKPLEEILDRAITAYNAGNSAQFWAEFSPSATPPPNDRTFQNIFVGYYKTDFGNVGAKKLIPSETQPNPDLGVLVYEAVCEKRPKVKISANFRREQGALKLVQVRFEKL